MTKKDVQTVFNNGVQVISNSPLKEGTYLAKKVNDDYSIIFESKPKWKVLDSIDNLNTLPKDVKVLVFTDVEIMESTNKELVGRKMQINVNESFVNQAIGTGCKFSVNNKGYVTMKEVELDKKQLKKLVEEEIAA